MIIFIFFYFFLHLPFLSQTIIMVLKQNIIKLRLLSFSHEFVYIYIHIYINKYIYQSIYINLTIVHYKAAETITNRFTCEVHTISSLITFLYGSHFVWYY